jgi:hypothetical protein
MKTRTFSFLVMLVLAGSLPLMAQNWVNGGNSLSATGRIGTNNGYSFAFETNNTERGRITSSGWWGIGTSTPSARFHANNTSFLVAKFSNSATTGDRTALVDIQNGHGQVWRYGVGGSGNGFGISSGQFYIERYGLGPVLIATTAGNVGIGTSNPGDFKFKVSHGSYGLAVENAGSQHNWEFLTRENGTLELYANDVFRGSFSVVDGSYSHVSDRRLKTNVEAMPSVLQKINQLKPSAYQYLPPATKPGARTALAAPDKPAAGNALKYGFIAQEVREVFPMLVHNHVDKARNLDLYTVDYSGFGVIAIKGIQELQGVIGAQQQTIQAQQQTISALEARLTRLEAATAAGTALNGLSRAPGLGEFSLEQNHPNPFNRATAIRYRVPAGVTAEILIRDVATGALVKQLPASAKGEVQLNANELRAGTYVYSLSVDGRVVASETMILLK